MSSTDGAFVLSAIPLVKVDDNNDNVVYQYFRSITVNPQHNKACYNFDIKCTQWEIKIGSLVVVSMPDFAAPIDPSEGQAQAVWNPFVKPWGIVQILSIYYAPDEDDYKIEVRNILLPKEIPDSYGLTNAPSALKSNWKQKCNHLYGITELQDVLAIDILGRVYLDRPPDVSSTDYSGEISNDVPILKLSSMRELDIDHEDHKIIFQTVPKEPERKDCIGPWEQSEHLEVLIEFNKDGPLYIEAILEILEQRKSIESTVPSKKKMFIVPKKISSNEEEEDEYSESTSVVESDESDDNEPKPKKQKSN